MLLLYLKKKKKYITHIISLGTVSTLKSTKEALRVLLLKYYVLEVLGMYKDLIGILQVFSRSKLRINWQMIKMLHEIIFYEQL